MPWLPGAHIPQDSNFFVSPEPNQIVGNIRFIPDIHDLEETLNLPGINVSILNSETFHQLFQGDFNVCP